MKLNKILILIVFICVDLHAQTVVSYSAYKEALNIINPSYVGVIEKKDLMIMTTFRGSSPQDSRQYLSFSSPLSKKLSVGVSILNDRYHINRETQIYADFSYKLKLDETKNIFLGLKGGGDFISRDFLSLNKFSDPEFSENISGQFSPNLGAGVYLECPNYFIAVAMPKFLKSEYENKRIDNSVVVSNPHIYVNAGYIYDLKNSFNMKVTPSLLYQYTTGTDTDSAFELGVNMEFLNKFEVGVANRFDYSFTVLTMFKFLDKFKVGFTYMNLTQNLSLNSYGIVLKGQF